MMRVLHWYWQTNTGGIHRVVSDLVGAQRCDPSLDVRCVVGRAGTLAGQPAARRTPAGVTCLGLRHGFDFSRYGTAREALGWADLVHMHGYNPVVALAVERLAKPCVYTDHGTDRHPSLRNRVVVGHFQRRFVRARADVVTVNSLFRLGERIDFYGIRDGRFRVVHNGLDFGGLGAKPSDPGLPAGVPVIGTVAVFNLRKRLHLLLETFARLDHESARLLIVGDGALRPRLEERAQALGIGDRVHFTGYREDARELIALMDVFVLPTQGEGFGLAAVEALGLERPVIVFRDGGGLTEIVRDGETGCVVDHVDDAARCLRWLLGDPALRRRLGAAGALDVRTRFSIEAMAHRTRRCYDEALAGRRRRTA
ncbi:MAG: glycosyltransferase family 4 protein [Planctomycetota bacterium]|jgi:glycosyltransferase involved in cell wall biosynthesis